MAEGMNGPLREAYDSIRELLAHAGRVEVRTRHEIGAIIAEVKRSRHKYGARAVPQLSDALGTDEQTLYRCATIAETWTRAQMDALLERTTPQGQPLTWSHFVLLTGVASPARRDELLDRSLRENLSVRRLSALAEDRETPQAEARSLDRLVRTTERLVHEMETTHREILSNLASTPRVPQARAALEQAIAATDRLRSLLERQSERLIAQCEKLPRASAERRLPHALAGVS
jgi:hypothetical protein